MGFSAPRLIDDGAAIELRLAGMPFRFHALWLRDNACDPATRDPGTGQRLITLLDVPTDTRIAAVEWHNGRLAVSFAPDGKQVDYDPAWLFANAYDRPAPPKRGWTSDAVTRWDAALAEDLPIPSYGAVRDDPAVLERWLAAVRRYGFARLTGVPTTDGIACTVAGLFGYVRETNYGRSFDVRVKARPDNLADTDIALQAHTDNPYRDPPPSLQILACLHNESDGGETVLVDGFKVAERLIADDPDSFALLADYNARFAYADAAGVRLQAKRPIIELGPDGELIAIRFNSRSAAPLVDIPYDAMADYYAACRRLATLIERPDLGLRFRLEPGDAFIVDNLRVLHGRRAFGGGRERWLQGCYADRDGLLSTLAALEEGNADG